MNRSMGHPSLRLVAWVCVIAALQRAHGWWLAGLLPLAVLSAGSAARTRWRGLLRRSRILLLVLAATYVLLTPGVALVAGHPGTQEGALAAADQLLRIVLMLGAVAWLLDSTPINELLAGIYGLARPSGRPPGGHGLAERFAIRLALVLRYAESPIAKDWRTLLDETIVEASGPVSFDFVPLRPIHWLAAFSLVAATLWILLRYQ